MSDLTETLAAMRDEHDGMYYDWWEMRRLLSGMEGVLALPGRAENGVQPVGNAYAAGYNHALADVRKALTDALGGE